MDRLTATNRLNDGGRLLVENPQAADLDIPLTNSIIPQRGVGAVSYTRATIATVTDHEGVIRNCIAGEARFQGARRVRNLTPFSQDVSVLWNKFSLTVSGTKVAYTDGSLIGQTIISSAASAIHYTSNGIGPVIIGNTYLFSVSVKAAGVNYVQLAFAASTTYQNFDLTNGSMTGTAGAGSVVDEGNGWYRCTVKFVSTLGTNAGQGIVIVSSMSDARLWANLGDGVSGISICRMQLEDVTGQSIQTPSEYVSTNVLTTAPFHGSNVDGIKCFKTTIAGLPISPDTLKGYLCEGARTNLCNYSNISVAGWGLISATRTDNAGIVPDGTNSFVKIIPNAGTQSSYTNNVNITTSASIYTVSCYVKADGLNFVQLRMSGSISNGYANFDLQNGVVGTRSLWTSSGIEPVIGLPGVYRIWAVTDTVLAATGAIAIQVVPAANSITGAAVTGDGVSGVMAWGMQIEAGVFVSSYIPTVAATVTRNADSLSYNASNVIDLKGAVYCEVGVNLPGYTNLSGFIIDRGANGRYLYANNSVTALNNYDGTNILLSNTGASYNGSVVKVATSWTGSTKSIYYGNTVPKTGVYVGTFGTGNINVGYSWNGTIRNVKVWKTPPTVAELTSITSQ